MQAKILIDKMQVGLVFESYKDDEYQQIMDLHHSVIAGDFGPGGKVWVPKPGVSLTNVHQPFPNDAYLHILYGLLHKKFRAWFEFNPGKGNLADVEGLLKVVLHYGHGSLVQRASITKCEIAIDVDDVCFDDYFFLEPAFLSHYDIYQSSGTQYLGFRHGARSFTCYDKRKELSDMHGIDLGYDRLRIEAKLRPKGVPLAALVELANPFAALLVIDRQLLAATQSAALHPLQLADSSHSSVQDAYRALAKQQRALVRQEVSHVQPTWWQPHALWQGYPEAHQWLDTWAASEDAMLAAINCTGGFASPSEGSVATLQSTVLI